MSTKNGAVFKTKELCGWGLAILCAAMIMLAKTGGVLTDPQVIFLAVTVFFIIVTAFELLDNFVIALLLPFSYLFFKIAPAAQVFNAWAGNIPWLILCGFVIANVLSRIGLLKRIVYWCLIKTGYGYRGIILGFAFAGIILELLTAGKSYIIVPAMAYAVCTSLNLGKSKTSAGIFLAASISSTAPGWFLYLPTGIGYVAAMASQVTPVQVDYVTFFMHNAPFVLLYFTLFFLVPLLFKQDVAIDGRDVLQKQLTDLGELTKAEKWGALLSGLFIMLLLTTSLHHIDIVYIFILWACSLFMPKIGICHVDDVRHINFSFILFVTGFISIGSAATAVGMGEVLSQAITPVIAQADNSFVLYGGVFVLGFIVNIFMTPLAAIASLVVPLTQIASDLNLNILPFLYVFLDGLSELVFPYEIAKFMVFYAYGLFTLKDFMKLFSIKAVLALVFILAVMLPYWHLIGLI